MVFPDDESISDWYAARTDRYRPPGTRDALAIVPEDRRGLHPFQDIPRLVVEWDGRVWQLVAVAADFSEAYPLIMRRDGELIEPQDDTPVALLRKGTGAPPSADSSEQLTGAPRESLGARPHRAADCDRSGEGGGSERVSGWGRCWGCGTVGVDFP
ncbi:hypothetical protein KV557_21625 [Kitasatospora aureofaciens]|uniref:DUF6087 family protein n=1 Tax=Kitasatospora aureofaciens TaxID=1894 RepID=UPI001C445E2A|nr:DUF6087 family protein [Kitasatospora aureofaciens]MBV6699665.1 hypothetical protein [Kitasatospora aureofaciens]